MFRLGLILLLVLTTARSQDVLESSGDVTLSALDITAEPSFSGEGSTEVVRHPAENDTDGDLPPSEAELLNGLDLSLDNSTDIDSNATTTTRREYFDSNGTTTSLLKTTVSTLPATTTTDAATTTGTTTTVAETTTTTMSATTTTTTTTTAVPSTTTRSTTTTTMTTTRATTTKQPRIPTTKFSRKPTPKSTTSHTIISTASPRMEAPCEILEDDFVCDVEISCFGEGTIDCEDVDEEEDAEPEGNEDTETNEETDDYGDKDEDLNEGDIDDIEYFPPELVGKAPPNSRLSVVWKMKSVKELENITATEPPVGSTTARSNMDATTMSETTTATTTEKVVPQTTLATEKATYPTAIPSEEAAAIPSNESASQLSPTAVTPGNAGNDSEVATEPAADSPPLDVSNSTSVMDGISLVNGSSDVNTESSDSAQTEKEVYTTDAEIKETTAAAAVVTSKKRRRKRESSGLRSEASSESLKLASQKSKDRPKSCKVTRSLHCMPVPNTAFCRGRGTCQVISIEKSEKSVTAKGVENWAIAVIVICATAAVLTIGLLVYLVVTSWKKLKVQPQNGVTTLNYVNNSPP